MDMRSQFQFSVNNNDYSFECETWQEAIAKVMECMNQSGFDIDTKRQLAINEVARAGRVTI